MAGTIERVAYPGQETAASARRSAAPDARNKLLAALPLTERRIELAGIDTALLEGGSGSPLVLLHGPGEHATKWLRVFPKLVETHRVVAPDLPGHGATEVGVGPISVDRVLAWLGALIEATCDEPPVLVGQIVGGAIAARFASARGSQIARLVLVDALGLRPFAPTPEFGRALADFLADANPDTHDRLWRRCAYDFDRLRTALGERWQWLKSYNLDRAAASHLHADQQRLMADFGLPAIPAEELEQIAVPTLLIWGRYDLATPLPVAEAASARYGWPLRVIDNAADDPAIEQPEAFLRALLEVPDAESSDVRAAWDGIGAGYDDFVTPSHLWLGNEGLRRAALRPRMRFLDVAAGSGALSIPAARLGARVVATDISAVMLERLAARARAEKLDVETRIMDGHALAFDDDTFDMSGSQFGVMLFPDAPRALRELARVTKPGGCVLMNVYGDPNDVQFIQCFVAALRAVRPDFPGLPVDPPPLPFQFREAETLRYELTRAGLREVRVETITETLEFHSGDELWMWLINSNPIVADVLDGLAIRPAEVRKIRGALDGLVRERIAGDAPAALTNPVNIGIGRK